MSASPDTGILTREQRTSGSRIIDTLKLLPVLFLAAGCGGGSSSVEDETASGSPSTAPSDPGFDEGNPFSDDSNSTSLLPPDVFMKECGVGEGWIESPPASPQPVYEISCSLSWFVDSQADFYAVNQQGNTVFFGVPGFDNFLSYDFEIVAAREIPNTASPIDVVNRFVPETELSVNGAEGVPIVWEAYATSTSD